MTAPETRRLSLFADTLTLAFSDGGSGRAFLLLHGGSGPGSVARLAGQLARGARVVAPTLPGFDGQPRPDPFARMSDLVLCCLTLLDRLDLSDVIVVGNSVGGWLAAELAARRSPRIAGVVLLDAVGIETGSPDRPIANPMDAAPAERAAMVFHDPTRFTPPPADPAALAIRAADQRALAVYAGDPFMHDPTLRARLSAVEVPTLVVWGESDRIVDVAYGRRYAESIRDARFVIVPEAGHLPQVEQTDRVTTLVWDFANSLAGGGASG